MTFLNTYKKTKTASPVLSDFNLSQFVYEFYVLVTVTTTTEVFGNATPCNQKKPVLPNHVTSLTVTSYILPQHENIKSVGSNM